MSTTPGAPSALTSGTSYDLFKDFNDRLRWCSDPMIYCLHDNDDDAQDSGDGNLHAKITDDSSKMLA